MSRMDELSFDRCVLVASAVAIFGGLAWAFWVTPQLRIPIGIAVGIICLIVAVLAGAIAAGGAALSQEGGENNRIGR